MKFEGVIFLLVFGLSQAHAESNSTIKTFKDWKAEKVQQVHGRILANKTQVDSLKLKKTQEPPGFNKGSEPHSKATAGIDQLIQHYEKQLAQEQWNLEVAQDLSVTDYIVLYLSSQTAKTRFQQAASQLTPSEVAEIMEAYSANLGIQTPAESVTTSRSLAPGAKTGIAAPLATADR